MSLTADAPPVPPIASVSADQPHTTVVPFSLEDDSAVSWALDLVDELNLTALDVTHPDPAGVNDLELSQLRQRFQWHLGNRMVVSAGRTNGRLPTLRFLLADFTLDEYSHSHL